MIIAATGSIQQMLAAKESAHAPRRVQVLEEIWALLSNPTRCAELPVIAEVGPYIWGMQHCGTAFGGLPDLWKPLIRASMPDLCARNRRDELPGFRAVHVRRAST